MKILKVDKDKVQVELTKRDVVDLIGDLSDNKVIVQFFVDVNLWMDEHPKRRDSLYGNKYE